METRAQPSSESQSPLAYARPPSASPHGAGGKPRSRRERLVAVAGVDVVADLSGALYWPDERLLVVADLHFEKGSAFARHGVLLPPYDTAATLEQLAWVLAFYDPRVVIALGDSFHDPNAPSRLSEEDRAALAGLQQGRDWVWIAGNHDPDPTRDVGGEFAPTIACGALQFRHVPCESTNPGEIAGHLHPCARVNRRGRTLTRRCFAGDANRLILPAFGAYAGGLNIRNSAFLDVFDAFSFTAYLIGDRSIYSLPASRCIG